MVDTRFYKFAGPFALKHLLQLIGAADLFRGVTDISISGADELIAADAGEIAFAGSRQYAEHLKTTRAGAVFISADLEDMVPDTAFKLITPDAQGLFASALEILYPKRTIQAWADLSATGSDRPEGIDPTAIIAPSATIGEGVEIGTGTVVGPNAVIGHGVAIGKNSAIGPNVTVEFAYLGDNVVLHPGARIGSEGFGWLDLGRSNRKIPQMGRVILQDGVEIGANSTIDRGALGDTTIGEGTKIDNLVQIGHNCRIGRNCLIAGTCGIAGSATIEDSVMLGGGAGVSGHINIGMGTIISARSVVTKDWPPGSRITGFPARDVTEHWRETAKLRRLAKGEGN